METMYYIIYNSFKNNKLIKQKCYKKILSYKEKNFINNNFHILYGAYPDKILKLKTQFNKKIYLIKYFKRNIYIILTTESKILKNIDKEKIIYIL